MKSKIVILIVIINVYFNLAQADWPHYTQCPDIHYVTKSKKSDNRIYAGFILYNSNKTNSYIAENFLGADIDSSYTLTCYYKANDGTDISAKFNLSKCSAHHGFNSSGECKNSNPDQCMAVCSY